MSIELVMLDMGDTQTAINLIRNCIDLMPDGFFSRAALCSPKPTVPLPDFIEHIPCSFQNGNMFGYNVWSVREFPKFIVCDYCLTIHRDGFILNPGRWENAFLDYDYIGAPWNVHQNGGNGGFYLQSKKFGQWISTHPLPIEDNVPADIYMCHVVEGSAKSAGIKYAPVQVGVRFSLELPIPQYPRTLNDVFGFHGKFHIERNPALRTFYT